MINSKKELKSKLKVAKKQEIKYFNLSDFQEKFINEPDDMKAVQSALMAAYKVGGGIIYGGELKGL